MDYKVRLYMDNTYEVYYYKGNGDWEVVYHGSLADCEAWIRLHENGYME